MFSSMDAFFLPIDKKDNEPVNEPELNLFIWAVLKNRIGIAKIFWRLGKVILLIIHEIRYFRIK